jgi:hypothetical protein
MRPIDIRNLRRQAALDDWAAFHVGLTFDESVHPQQLQVCDHGPYAAFHVSRSKIKRGFHRFAFPAKLYAPFWTWPGLYMIINVALV